MFIFLFPLLFMTLVFLSLYNILPFFSPGECVQYVMTDVYTVAENHTHLHNHACIHSCTVKQFGWIFFFFFNSTASSRRLTFSSFLSSHTFFSRPSFFFYLHLLQLLPPDLPFAVSACLLRPVGPWSPCFNFTLAANISSF